MRTLTILCAIIMTGCSLFKTEVPIIEEPTVEEPTIKEVNHCDSVKLDTSKFSIIDLINVIDTNNIIIDTLKSE